MKGRPSLYQGKDNAAAADCSRRCQRSINNADAVSRFAYSGTTILSKDIRPVPLCLFKRKGPLSLSQNLILSPQISGWGGSVRSFSSVSQFSHRSKPREDWGKGCWPTLTHLQWTPNRLTTQRFQISQLATSNLKQPRPRRMWIGQKDSGLKAWGAVPLLRATDSSTHSHSSGWTLLQSLATKTFVEKSFQYCQLPKLGLHGKLWDWRNLLHFVSVHLKGTNNPHTSCLKHLKHVFDDNDPIQGGNSDGSCAAGFGTCCTFSAPCDSETTQNGTYFSRW